VRYRIEYSPDAETHMRALAARQRAIVLAGVERRLSHEPTRETKNRKRMRPNLLAPWELRLGDLRVYYDVAVDPSPAVYVRAVGAKEGSQVRIGKETIKL
jgi:mRNA-degrading endonuclease RelE of RelBE toxin-antitoxin system